MKVIGKSIFKKLYKNVNQPIQPWSYVSSILYAKGWIESILCKFIPNSYFDVSLLVAGIAEIDSWSMGIEYNTRSQLNITISNTPRLLLGLMDAP